eukprot:CFRG4051T1
MSSSEDQINHGECLTAPTLGDAFQGENSFVFQTINSFQVLYHQKKKVPKIVGRYILGNVLGEGSYGKVKEGIHTENLTRVAVKILKKKKLRKIANGEANVRREIVLLRKLSHPHIIQLYDVLYNEEKQKLYMTMEYCIGGLQEMIDNCDNGLPVWQAHSYFVQLIDGIQYIHSKGVIHRDIKPGNLLLSREGDIKICDFGVAEELDIYAPTDRCTSSAGSPAFQAPEIASGKPEYCGFKVDIWALGITLFNLVTGEYPFSGDNIYDLFENISACNYSIPDNLDASLSDIISKMLCEDVDKRFSIDQIIHHEWYMTAHDRSEPAAPLPVADIYNSTTLIPYLEDLYEDCEDDDENTNTRLEVNSGWVPAAGRLSTNFHDNVDSCELQNHLRPQRGTQAYDEQPRPTSPRGVQENERTHSPATRKPSYTGAEEFSVRLTKSRSTINSNVERKIVKKVGSKCNPM